MKNGLSRLFSFSLLLTGLGLSSITASAHAATDEQTMNSIISQAGNVGAFNASRTVVIPLTQGTTEAIAESNSAKISSAINAAAAGTAIQLPAGEYSIASEIFIRKSNVALQGTMNGSNLATTIHCTKSLTNIHPEYARMGNSAPSHGGGGIFTLSSVSNVHIRNFIIHFSTRTRYKYNDGYNAIYLVKTENCSVRNMKIDDFEIAVSTTSTTNCLIDGLTLNSVRGAHFAFNLGEKTTRTKVNNVTSIGVISHDLSLQGCSNNVYQNIILNPNRAYGSAIDFRGGFAAITNNVFKNIRLDDSSALTGNNAVKGSSFDDNPITFGHCYYSNVYYRSGGQYVLFSQLSGTKASTLKNYIHFVNGGTTPPPPANVAPVVNAGADKIATLSGSSLIVTFNGTVSDADGDATTKQWSKVSGPANVLFSAPTAATTNATFTMVGTYGLRLTANDGKGHIVSDDIQVVISKAPVNVAPIVNAGANKTATLSGSSVLVSLSGNVTDPNGDATTKQWSKVSGPANVSFSASTAAATNATFTMVGTYVLRLTAKDVHNHIASDDVQVVIGSAPITPEPPVPPVGGGVVYEAEKALLQGAVADGIFVDYINASGDFIEWTLNASKAGAHLVSIRYALSNGNRPLQIKLNGTVVQSSLSFPATGSFANYGTVSFQVMLPAGVSRLRATAIGSSGANVDRLELKAL